MKYIVTLNNYKHDVNVNNSTPVSESEPQPIKRLLHFQSPTCKIKIEGITYGDHTAE